MRKFLVDPKWTPEQTQLHKERFNLQVEMDSIYREDHKRYSILAKRYHELCAILDKDEPHC